MEGYICRKKSMENLHKTLLGLMELCREHINEIKEHKNLGHLLQNLKVRFITPEGWFDYTTFGNFYFTSAGVMMLITRDKYTNYRVMDIPMGLWSTVPVIFAGIETGYRYDNTEPIYSDDICSANGCVSVVRFFEGDNLPSLAGDNCDLLLQDCHNGFHKVGTIWYDVNPDIFEIRNDTMYGGWSAIYGGDLDKVAQAKERPQFMRPLNKIPPKPLMYMNIQRALEEYPCKLCIFSEKRLEQPEDEDIDPELADIIYSTQIYCDEDCNVDGDTQYIELDDYPDDDSLFYTEKMVRRFREPIRRLIQHAYAHPETRFVVCSFIKEMDLPAEVIDQLKIEFNPIIKYKIRNLCIPIDLVDWNCGQG